MKYVSTRGQAAEATFEDTLFSGCPDGGMFVPKSVPSLSRDTLRDWSSLTFVQLSKRIARLYISEDEISTTDLNGILERAFRSFSHPDVAPVTRLPGGLNVLELYHGKTLSFKDLALSCVSQLLEYFLAKRRKRVVICVCTSGDTGSAAIEGVRESEWADILVFMPEVGCSKLQVLQMVTVVADNVHIFKVKTDLGQIDAVEDALSSDEAFSRKHGFMSVNSVNWTRIMMQTVHYFYGYFQVCGEVGDEVEFVVPCGAGGDLAAGTFAREMGLPIRFACAVNSNDIFRRGLSKGDYSMRTVTVTLAPAMDIDYPYNIERVLYNMSGGDHVTMQKIFTEFKAKSSCRFPDNLVEKVKSVINTHSAHDGRIQEVMKRCWDERGYAVCPHTAVGLSYYYQQQDSEVQSGKVSPIRICLATASPAKFPETLSASGVTPQVSPKLEGIEQKLTKFTTLPKDINYDEFVRSYISNITQKRTADI